MDEKANLLQVRLEYRRGVVIKEFLGEFLVLGL